MSKRSILLVEDEVADALQRPFREYNELVTVEVVDDAADALRRLEKATERPDVMILDIMIPYGDEATTRLLDPGGQDRASSNTGKHLLKHLRDGEAKLRLPPLWVAVVTGRGGPRVLAELGALVSNGRGRVYVKPINDIELEADVCEVLHIGCKQPKWLLESVWRSR